MGILTNNYFLAVMMPQIFLIVLLVDWIFKTADILNEDTQLVSEDFDVDPYTWEVFRMYGQ